MSDSDKEENDEVGKDKNVILHVAVVGFHHKKGRNQTVWTIRYVSYDRS